MPTFRAVRIELVSQGASAVALLVLSALTVMRYTYANLQADGVEQSVMSVQDIDLFYWGQDRLAPVVSWLASPIADPGANLWVCLMLQAMAFHGLLLAAARVGTPAVAGDHSWSSTLLLFLALAAVAHACLTPQTLWALALEGQPYALSFLCALLAFVAWRRRRVLPALVAVALVWVMLGLNPSAVLVLATLAVVTWLRERRFWWWALLGAVSAASLLSWTYLAAEFGGQAGAAEENPPYFEFRLEHYATSIPAVFHNLVSCLRLPWFPAMLFVAVLATLALPEERRRAFLPRFALAGGFAAAYTALFTANTWIGMNDWHFRYFAPVPFLVILSLGAPVAAVVLAGVRSLSDTRVRHRAAAVAVGGAVLACGAGIAGPVRDPSDAAALQALQPTAAWAADHDVRFFSGYYWDMWPLLHVALREGRDAAFVTGFKSGGDPAGYRRAFQEEQEDGGTPRAVCVNAPVADCQEYLARWTEPGWQETGEQCPVPPLIPPLGDPPVRACVALEFTG